MNKIFLWGPAGSGKTWLFNSFIRKINLLRMVFKSEGSKYDVWVEDVDGNEIEINELTREVTLTSNYQEVVYRREVTHTDLDSNLLSNTHIIGMLDGPGDETTGQLEVDRDTQENQNRVKAARLALQEADYLFVVVHPGKRALIGDGDQQQIDQEKAGEHFLDRLNALLRIHRKETQDLRICFTQSDLYAGGLGVLKSALAYLFGSRGKEIEVKLRKLFPASESTDPPIYYMSSVGYYKDSSNKRKANYDQTSFSLLNEAKWNPNKVLEPFFDVFDEVQEKHLIRFNTSNSILNPILMRLFASDRLNLYRKYSNRTMLQEGEKRINAWLG